MPDSCIVLSDLQTLACVETVGTLWFTALLFKWLYTLARGKLLFQAKSVGDEWRDTFCSPVTLLRDLFIFECYRFYFIWSIKKRLKKKMPQWTISVSLPLPLTGCFLRESLSQLFLQLLIVPGLSFHVGNFWLLLGFLPVPFSSSPFEIKTLFPLHLESLFPWQETKGRKVTTFRPVNTKWAWENHMLPRSGDAVPDGEIADVWAIPASLLGWRSRSERQDSCGGEQNSFPVSLSTLFGLLRRGASRCLSAELQWILHKKL